VYLITSFFKNKINILDYMNQNELDSDSSIESLILIIQDLKIGKKIILNRANLDKALHIIQYMRKNKDNIFRFHANLGPRLLFNPYH
jgi:hypothetical protein